MPSPKQKRIIVLQSSVEGSYDESDFLDSGRLLRGDRDAERLLAGSDADWWIEGRGGGGTIAGAGGNDLLIARRAILGEDGRGGDPDTDEAVGARTGGRHGGDVTMDGGGGDDLIIGGDGDDSLAGGDGADSLHGFEGDDELAGGIGDDLLAPGTGASTLDGGDGLDTASWADLPYRRGAGEVAGIVLNLSGDLLRYESGDHRGDARILAAGAAGGFQLLGDADTAPVRGLRPEGETAFDIADGTGAVPAGLVLPSIQTIREVGKPVTVERFEGTLGDADVAVLDEGFALVGRTGDGYQRWSDGIETLEFREFEVILIG